MQTIEAYNEGVKPKQSFYLKELGIDFKDKESLEKGISSMNTNKMSIGSEKKYMYNDIFFETENDLLQYIKQPEGSGLNRPQFQILYRVET